MHCVNLQVVSVIHYSCISFIQLKGWYLSNTKRKDEFNSNSLKRQNRSSCLILPILLFMVPFLLHSISLGHWHWKTKAATSHHCISLVLHMFAIKFTNSDVPFWLLCTVTVTRNENQSASVAITVSFSLIWVNECPPLWVNITGKFIMY